MIARPRSTDPHREFRSPCQYMFCVCVDVRLAWNPKRERVKKRGLLPACGSLREKEGGLTRFEPRPPQK